MTKRGCGVTAGAVVWALMFGGTAMAKTASPEETCKNDLLTYRQRYLCQQELDNIQTKADQKKVVRKFQDMIKAAQMEKEKAEK